MRIMGDLKGEEETFPVMSSIIVEVGVGAAALFRLGESLVFRVEEEVQSYLVLEEVQPHL